MSHPHRKRRKKYIYLVELVCLEKLDYPSLVRGYIFGNNEQYLYGECDKWRELKMREILESADKGTRVIGVIRGYRAADLEFGADITGAVDIRIFLRNYDKRKREVPPDMEFFERQMQEHLRSPDS